MNPPSDQLLARLGQLIQAGARLYFWDGQPSLDLQAAEWIPGRGLLYAARGAIDQSGVHLVGATLSRQTAYVLSNGSLASDAETDEIDINTGAGDLVATIMRDTEAQPLPPPTAAWSRFWAQEIQNAKGAE